MKALLSHSQKVDTTLAMLEQVGALGEDYDAWVHQPSTQRAFRMFESPILEAGSKTQWWVVLLVWPWVAALAFASSLHCSAKWQTIAGFGCAGSAGLRPATAALVAGVGVLMWTLVEYVLHRAVFHYPTTELSQGWIKLHFLLHGQHHKFPLDNQRLVFPIVPAAVIAGFFLGIFRLVLPFAVAHALFAGFLGGYVTYDMIHYYVHHGPRSGIFGTIRKAHMDHHFRNHDAGYGISSPIWDFIFETMHLSRKT